ncbi:DUF916 domain-containing protein [Lactobacillus sp. DCY120]|uniref:DUF916 domain-containing protein n=1 Tax=Bombilactobacillus apium TaxID=2675299 RepID=A0A850R1K6_9LACO|nr:DUF916 domain-containing protein [Bombilactobacillus apium]NVY96240.1 DUF916 domain-containing protein [Bombilactobacillus apium]
MRKIYFFICLTLLLVISGLQVESKMKISFAAVSANTYTVKAILPVNQVDSQASFYNLRVRSGKRQTLKLRVTNLADQILIVKTQINDAYTSNNGVVNYDRTQVTPVRKDQPVLSRLIVGTRTQKLHLKARSSKLVKFTYQAPKKHFTGIILGGITTVAKVVDRSVATPQINPRIRYVTGIVLHPQLESNQIRPQVSMRRNFPKISKKGLQLKLQNQKLINLSPIQLRVALYRGQRKIRQQKFNNCQLAPNSNWVINLPWTNLTPGNYQVRVNLKSPSYRRSFRRNLIIGAQQDSEGSLIKLLTIKVSLIILVIVVVLNSYRFLKKKSTN